MTEEIKQTSNVTMDASLHQSSAVFNFFSSFRLVYISTIYIYISNFPNFPCAVHFPSLINAESADYGTIKDW